MPYNVRLNDQDGNPLNGYITFYDEGSKGVGLQNVTAGGSEIASGFITAAFSGVASSPGYYDFNFPINQLSEGTTDIQLQKKPTSDLVHYGIGAAIGFVIAKLLKI